MLSASGCFGQSSGDVDRRWRLMEDSSAVIPYRTWLRMVGLRVASDSLRGQLKWEAVRRAQLMSLCEDRYEKQARVVKGLEVEVGVLREERKLVLEEKIGLLERNASLRGWATVGKVGTGVVAVGVLAAAVVM